MKRTLKGRLKNGETVKRNNWDGYTCGECAHGEWNDVHFDYKGQPFLIYCEHSQYAYSPRRQCATCYSDTAACEHFIEGKKGGTQ